MRDDRLAGVRERFLANTQATLRKPRAVIGTAAIIYGLAALPLIPGARAALAVDVADTMVWATTYVAMSLIGFVVHRRLGLSRLFWIVSMIESAAFMHGTVVLGAIGGSVASPWLILTMLSFTFLATSGGHIADRGSLVVCGTTPLVAAIAYAHLGIGPAATAFVLMALGLVGYFIIAEFLEKFFLAQAEQVTLHERIGQLEREVERRQIARDLHDSVGSSLALVATYGALVEQYADRPEELKRLSTTLREASRDGLDDLRGLLDAMAPVDATVGGLASSLERIAGRVAPAASIAIELHAPGDQVLQANIRLAALRVFQEAISNAIRHGKATKIDARLGVEAGALELAIRDDGGGFDVSAPSDGRGLVNIRARAGELRGACTIDSKAGAGTSIRFSVPL